MPLHTLSVCHFIGRRVPGLSPVAMLLELHWLYVVALRSQADDCDAQACHQNPVHQEHPLTSNASKLLTKLFG